MFQSIKQLIFANKALCQAKAFERPTVPKGVEHAVCSTNSSINQPPTTGQAGPSGPLEVAQVLGLFTTEQVEMIS